MAQTETPFLRLYLIGAVCTLFATAYGALNIKPSPAMETALTVGPAIGVAMWLAADAKRARFGAVYEAGWFFYIGLPIAIPWYAFGTRGRGGWWLAFKLYGIAFGGALGFVWGELLRRIFGD